MANHAYLRLWTRDFSESTMIAEFARFLTTAPLSKSHPHFDELVVQAVDPAETPVAEWDGRGQGYGAAEIAALAAQHLNADTAYIATAQWDLWSFDIESLKWQRKPAPLELLCHGPQYDGGVAESAGHFPPISALNILSPAMADCLPRARLRTRLIPRIIPSSARSGAGCPRRGTEPNITQGRVKTSNC